MCIVLLGCHAFAVKAESDLSKQLFAKGIAAYNTQNYQQALTFFNRSSAEGLQDERLFYNMGSAYYRIGQYGEAYQAYEKSAKHSSLAPVARYSMGLAAMKMDHQPQAIENFLLSYRLSTNEQQKALAFRMLNKMNAGHRVTIKQKWNSVMAANYGYSSNATTLHPDYTLLQDNVADQYQRYFVSVGFRPIHNLQFEFRNVWLNYMEIDTRDMVKSALNGKYRYTFSRLLLDVNMGSAVSFLNGRSFQRNSHAGLEASYSISKKMSLSVGYQWNDYRDLDKKYDYLSGTMSQLTWAGTINQAASRYRLEFSVELNDRHDYYENEMLSQSFSPQRFSAAFHTSHKMSKRFTWSTVMQYKTSRYRDPNQIQKNLENDIKKTRNDNWYQLGSKLHYHYQKYLWFIAEVFYNNNASNIDAYRYDSKQVSMGVVFRY